MNKLVANSLECPIIYDRNRGKAGNLSHEFVTLTVATLNRPGEMKL